MSSVIQKRRRVGIDLGPASMKLSAPGTARHVEEQARALLAIDVPWTWVPIVESLSNPLYQHLTERGLAPVVVRGRKIWTRATFGVGKAWVESACDLGFATAYFVPWQGCKVVANFFDSSVYEYGWTWVKTGRRWNYYLNRLLSTVCLRRAERVFVNSQYCAEVLRRRFPTQAGKIYVSSPGILPPLASEKDVRPHVLANLRKPYCLFVGVLSENKNQVRLIEAWSKWQQASPEVPALVLVASRTGEYFRSKVQVAQQASEKPSEIIITGFLTDQEVSWCYRNASLYIQPSFAEGFGLPVVEAMSYGVPVALSNSTSLPEVGGDAAVYFNPANVESMANVVRNLWTDTEKRRVLAERGRLRSQHFNWERNAQEVARQIDSVLQETSAR